MSAEAGLQQPQRNIVLEAALQRIEQLLGLRYQQHQWSDLLRLLKPAASELGFDDVAACVTWIASGDVDESDVRVLGKHLTIGESYFFREIVVFTLLREHVLPEIIAAKEKSGRREIAIWSAGCSTGEEVYSIAILLDSMLEKKQEWNVRVLGTDINPNALERAVEGRYREWSFRDIPAGIIQQYFHGTDDGKLEVARHIREMTSFEYLNLAAPHALYPAGFDIVLCRNVLMYFTRPKIQHIVQGFRRAVLDRGWLIPSLTETTLINNPGFEGVRYGDATLFRKQSRVSHILSLRRQGAAADAPEESGVPAPRERKPVAPVFPLPGPAHPEPVRSSDSVRGSDAARDSDAARQKRDTVVAESRTPQASAAKRATDLTARTDATLRKARTLADQGKLEDARRLAEEAVENEKMHPQARFIYATILRELGETSRAMQEFHRALYLDHGHIAAHFAVGSLYRHLGQMQNATRHFRNALQLLEACEDPESVVEPGEISVRRMIEIIKTMLKEG